ncbi:MAG: STAS domain-containing protein [Thermoleophilaceae bacterium]
MENDPIHDYVPESPFKQHEERLDERRLVVTLDGELDMYVTTRLAGRLHQIAEDAEEDVVVDLSGARFIDTTVLEAFVNAQKELQAHKHALAVVAPGPYTRRTFELTGLNDVLRVSASRDEALSRLPA